MVWVSQYLYFLFQIHKNNQFQKKEKEKKLMLIPCVAINCFQLIRSHVTHIFFLCQNLKQLTKSVVANVKNMTHHIVLGKFLNDQGAMDTGIHKSKYHLKYFSEVLKSRSRGDVLQYYTAWWPINKRWCMLNIIHQFSTLSEIIEINILGEKTKLVIIPVQFVHMMGTFVTLPSLRIHI